MATVRTKRGARGLCRIAVRLEKSAAAAADTSYGNSGGGRRRRHARTTDGRAVVCSSHNRVVVRAAGWHAAGDDVVETRWCVDRVETGPVRGAVLDRPAGRVVHVIVQVRTADRGQRARAGSAQRGHLGRAVPGTGVAQRGLRHRVVTVAVAVAVAARHGRRSVGRRPGGGTAAVGWRRVGSGRIADAGQRSEPGHGRRRLRRQRHGRRLVLRIGRRRHGRVLRRRPVRLSYRLPVRLGSPSVPSSIRQKRYVGFSSSPLPNPKVVRPPGACGPLSIIALFLLLTSFASFQVETYYYNYLLYTWTESPRAGFTT